MPLYWRAMLCVWTPLKWWSQRTFLHHFPIAGELRLLGGEIPVRPNIERCEFLRHRSEEGVDVERRARRNANEDQTVILSDGNWRQTSRWRLQTLERAAIGHAQQTAVETVHPAVIPAREVGTLPALGGLDDCAAMGTDIQMRRDRTRFRARDENGNAESIVCQKIAGIGDLRRMPSTIGNSRNRVCTSHA